MMKSVTGMRRPKGLRFASWLQAAVAILALPAIAQAAGSIDNSAVATGTYNGVPYNSAPAIASVPLADPTLTVSLDVSGAINDGGDGVDAGDTVTYTLTITNTANVTLTDVTPAIASVLFNGTAGAGSWGSFSTPVIASLAPGGVTTVTIDYTLAAADIFTAAAVTDGVLGAFDVEGTGPGAATASANDSGPNTIPAEPSLQIAKAASTSSAVSVGETVTYTYTVTNNGNVPLSNVSITDTHEPGTPHELILASASATGNTTGPWDEQIDTEGPVGASVAGAVNGVIDVLQPGAVATFTYVHTVRADEFEAQ